MPEIWIQRLKNGRYIPLTAKLYDKVRSAGQAFLAPSSVDLPNAWRKVVIHMFCRDSDAEVLRLVIAIGFSIFIHVG